MSKRVVGRRRQRGALAHRRQGAYRATPAAEQLEPLRVGQPAQLQHAGRELARIRQDRSQHVRLEIDVAYAEPRELGEEGGVDQGQRLGGHRGVDVGHLHAGRDQPGQAGYDPIVGRPPTLGDPDEIVDGAGAVDADLDRDPELGERARERLGHQGGVGDHRGHHVTPGPPRTHVTGRVEHDVRVQERLATPELQAEIRVRAALGHRDERVDGLPGRVDGDPRLRPLRPEVHELVLDAVRAGEVALLGGQEEQALQMRAGLWLLRSHGGDELGALIDGHVHEKPPLHEGVEDPITSADASWTAGRSRAAPRLPD